ncbi:hypothetical protein [Aquabacterium sp.]|uniref:hypothetical protein n=1 Tax=Aquabacterium sp. TaxID=1872578 RepID=UPI002E31C048|nr:hypothetical protein [Aquabacterium sp.]HEX5312327.1 hypothetical protein [Aquabacterium sp.]
MTPRVPDSVPSNMSIRKVAVISVTARTFARAYTGLTVFNNEYEEMDIRSWKADQSIENRAKDILKDMGIASVDNDTSMDAFLAVNDPRGGYPDWGKAAQPALAYCAKHELDALIVLARSNVWDFLGETNQSFSGAGIYARGPVNNVSVLHLVAEAGVIDCQTGKALATRRLTTSSSDSMRDIISATPRMPSPMIEAMRPMAQWTDEQKTRYKGMLERVLSAPMEPTLRKLLGQP